MATSVLQSGAFSETAQPKVYSGGAWVPAVPKVYNGSEWVTCFQAEPEFPAVYINPEGAIEDGGLSNVYLLEYGNDTNQAATFTGDRDRLEMKCDNVEGKYPEEGSLLDISLMVEAKSTGGGEFWAAGLAPREGTYSRTPRLEETFDSISIGTEYEIHELGVDYYGFTPSKDFFQLDSSHDGYMLTMNYRNIVGTLSIRSVQVRIRSEPATA